MMKKNFIKWFAGALLAGMVCGCNDDKGLGERPSAGSRVNFSLSSAVSTRTVYDENNIYQIDWIEGDKVRIYCDEAEDVKRADYEVVAPIDESNRHTSTLKYNENGLAWGTDNGMHNFYAVYPADDNRVNVQDGIATFTINSNQVCEVNGSVGADGHYTTTPDMTNAYMVANLSTTPVDKVPLMFHPVMTTLNITVRGRETANTGNVVLTGISIVNNNVQSSDAENGVFRYDIANSTMVNSGTGSNAKSSETTFVRIKNGSDLHLELEPGQSVTFTVFLPPMPIDAANQVDVRVHATGETVQQVTIGGNMDKNNHPVEFAASSKGRLTLPYFPVEQNGNNWITPLDDDIYVSQLSIPGTHDAATSKVTGLFGSTGKTQDYTIEEQLNMGIRAFDLRPTCPYVLFDNSELPIYHGIVNCDITLKEVFGTFNKFLATNPKEFIVVCCRWENERDPHVDPAWGKFNEMMTAFLNNAMNYPSSRQVAFKPDLTIGEMRGKILIIMRPNQGTSPDGFYADEAITGTTFISGWPAGGADVRTGVYFKSRYEGAATGYAVVQDYYEVENTTTKIDLIKQELDMSAQSHTNNDYTNTWFINHCSGYSGSVASNMSYSNNAQVVNPRIYEYLTGTEKTVGSTGIMLLDFVGKRVSSASGMTVYGDLLPQAIIDNNYKYRMKRKGE